MHETSERLVEDAVRELLDRGETRIRARLVWIVAMDLAEERDVRVPNAGEIGRFLIYNRDLGFAEIADVEETEMSNIYVFES